jgi:hypothetical protein
MFLHCMPPTSLCSVSVLPSFHISTISSTAATSILSFPDERDIRHLPYSASPTVPFLSQQDTAPNASPIHPTDTAAYATAPSTKTSCAHKQRHREPPDPVSMRNTAARDLARPTKHSDPNHHEIPTRLALNVSNQGTTTSLGAAMRCAPMREGKGLRGTSFPRAKSVRSDFEIKSKKSKKERENVRLKKSTMSTRDSG